MHGQELRGHCVVKGRFHAPGRFGRMFPHLRSLKSFTPEAEVLGRAGGPMDGGAGLDAAQDNPRIPAGFTFLGQFIDHDITFDPTSSLESQNDPEAIRNFRTPALELDSVYGGGPRAQPYLYDQEHRGQFLLSEDGFDVPRNRHHRAIIGDPRNDENLIISQLHLAFMKFHNAVFTRHAGENFEEAQRLVRWHYQWIVLHEFLGLTCGDEERDGAENDVVGDILRNGRRFFGVPCLAVDEEMFMPVEFSAAAYRFGHSQVRPGYRINANLAAALFPGQPNAPFDREDLRGSRPINRERAVDWQMFFGSGKNWWGRRQQGKLIDRRLSSPLLRLPDTMVQPATPEVERSLAVRNLKRGLAFALPSGQAVATYMGIPVLPDAQVWQDVPNGTGPAPLWFYILREAEFGAAGQRLHGVGARIVAEVLIGLLQGDSASFLNQDRSWKPTLPRRKEQTFTMVDLLTVAGLFPDQ